MKIGEIMSQEILVIHQAEAEKLGEPVAALIPVGEVLALYATAQDQNSEVIGAKIGIWESSPGQFRRAVKEREFSHIIQGSCIFTPDEGPSIELKAVSRKFSGGMGHKRRLKKNVLHLLRRKNS